MKTKAESHLSPLFPIGLFALFPSLVFGAGLAAIKEQTFHQDAGANVVAYSALKDDGSPSIKIETGSKSFTIARQKLAGKVEVLPSLPATITNETELEIVRTSAKEYRAFSAKFPKSAPVLSSHINALDACIKEFEGGKARYNGEWMPKEEALAAKHKEEQSRNEEEAAIKRKREEKMAFEQSQKSKGLAKYDGKWIPEDEAQRLALRDQAAIEKDVDTVKNAERKMAQEQAILAASKDAVLQVIQSDDDGVLCKVAFVKNGTDSDWSKDSFGRTVKTKRAIVFLGPFSEQTVYVIGVSGAVDGAMVQTKLIDTGKIHPYRSVTGARITVSEFQAVGEIRPYSGRVSSPSDTAPNPPSSSLQSVGGG